MGCRMSLKVYMLDAHLDKFNENMGAYSEEQGERFHQDILDFERRYQGTYSENMMGDYIWGLIRENDLQYNPLVVRFLTKRFIWEYDSSQERTYRHQTVIDEEHVLLEILDTAGQAKDDSLQREGMIRWADGFVIVYAVNDKESFEEARDTKQYLDQVKRTNVHCVLIGNKTDLLHERKVTTSEGRQLALELSCAFVETSASDSMLEISEAFQDLHRDIRRRKQMEGKPRRRSSAQQMRQAFSKMFKIQGPT